MDRWTRLRAIGSTVVVVGALTAGSATAPRAVTADDLAGVFRRSMELW